MARNTQNANNSDTLEQQLWKAADKLRKNIDAAEYKHVVLGLIFLRYISSAFETLHAKLDADEWADPEDRDEYRAENVFFVPPPARWSFLQANAKDPEIGKSRRGDGRHRSGEPVTARRAAQSVCTRQPRPD